MNPLAPIRSLAVLACLCSTPTAPQEQGEPAGLPVLSLQEIALDQYHVQNADAEQLFELALDLAGRQYFVREHGGESSAPVTSLRLLGETIVLYDKKEEVQRARDLIFKLDAPAPTFDSGWSAVEFRPRFVSLVTAQAAVANLIEVSRLDERGMIVLQGSAQGNQMALELLKRIDVPERQVLLTCQLLDIGGDAPPGPALPKPLLDNLQKLLPGTQFSQAGMALLQTSVTGQKPIALQIESPGKRYRLSLTPVAFDESSGSLTVVGCSLTENPDSNEERELFRTNTVLRGGEYTVLAGTGATPRLLVVRVVLQG
jgi:hypothetical protein